MQSERLRYRPVELADLDAFHRLVEDEHVRRYLMDGEVMPREWSEEQIRNSQELFERRGVGLWLVYEPQVLYALFERFTGRGYATEMGGAAIAEARERHGFTEILAGADAVNVASLRVLEKLGFERISTHPGHFGDTFLLRSGG